MFRVKESEYGGEINIFLLTRYFISISKICKILFRKLEERRKKESTEIYDFCWMRRKGQEK